MTRGQADRWVRAVLRRAETRATTRLVAAYLAHAIADGQAPTQRQLAEVSGLHSKTVGQAVGELAALGALSTDKFFDHATYEWARLWRLHDEEEWT